MTRVPDALSALRAVLALPLVWALSAGALFDVGADAVFLLSGLAASWVLADLPGWVPLVAAAMLARFLATSPTGAPLYDPVGRHYGTLLYLVLGVWILDTAPAARGGVLAVWVVATGASLVGRAWFLRTRVG